MKKKSLVIVGAGISGLYLASLLQKNFNITILEARERIGGRIYSINGHDMGPSWVWSHQKNVLNLMRSLNIKLFAQYSTGAALYDTKERVETFTAPPSTPSARVDGSLSLLIEKLHTSLKNSEIIRYEKVNSIAQFSDCIKITTQNKIYESDFVVVTLPPRLCAKLSFTPELPKALKSTMQNTPTWMGNSAKCVVVFKNAFWKTMGLSGFAFSVVGPLAEIHDACTKKQAALFGFVNLNTDMRTLKEDVKQQMLRLFQIDESEIISIDFVDWKAEQFTAVNADKKSLTAHPNYGIDTKEFSNKILFSSTEFSSEEGGYIEGAVVQAKKVADYLFTTTFKKL